MRVMQICEFNYLISIWCWTLRHLSRIWMDGMDGMVDETENEWSEVIACELIVVGELMANLGLVLVIWICIWWGGLNNVDKLRLWSIWKSWDMKKKWVFIYTWFSDYGGGGLIPKCFLPRKTFNRFDVSFFQISAMLAATWNISWISSLLPARSNIMHVFMFKFRKKS